MFLYDMVIFRFVCLQNDAEFNTGKMLSFAPGSRQQNTNFEDLQISQKVKSAMPAFLFVFFLGHVSFVIEA
jgi:hypothetical protein